MSSAYYKGDFTMKLDRIAPLLDQAIHHKCQNAMMQNVIKKENDGTCIVLRREARSEPVAMLEKMGGITVFTYAADLAALISDARMNATDKYIAQIPPTAYG